MSNKRGLMTWIPILLMLLIALGIPLGILGYQAHHSGMTWSQILRRALTRASGPKTGLEEIPSTELPPGERIDFLRPQPIGEGFSEPPRVANVLAVDLDQDGLLDAVVCDARKNSVSWIRQQPRGTFTEQTLVADLIAPAHVQATDFDADGDLDLVVAVLGQLFPNNDLIGSVVILENTGEMRFARHVVAEKTARVSDVRAGDLDGDGDLDLAVAQFGYDDGQTQWLENLGGWKFRSHILQSLSGPINCEIADLNADGHPDITVLVSQEWEELYVFVGDGRGNFQPRLLWGSDNEDYGSSGMSLVDLDEDGDLDILYTNGDAFDYLPPTPRSWHGVQWLENQGSLDFQFHRVAEVPGAARAEPADIDHDGDLDLVVVSAYNYWEDPRAQSLVWLENSGRMQFRRHDLTNTPTHLITLSLGDFDGDGETDLVTGGMHTYAPFDRMERVVLWHNRWPATLAEQGHAAPAQSPTNLVGP